LPDFFFAVPQQQSLTEKTYITSHKVKRGSTGFQVVHVSQLEVSEIKRSNSNKALKRDFRFTKVFTLQRWICQKLFKKWQHLATAVYTQILTQLKKTILKECYNTLLKMVFHSWI